MARPPQKVHPRRIHKVADHRDREEITAHLVEHLRRAPHDRERISIRSQLVEINLPLCDALAARYSGRGVDPDDLKQVARTALVSAVAHFRPDEAPSLAAFAVPTITGELKRHFRDRCWVVRPPRALQELRPAALRACRDLEQRMGRSVSTREIAMHLGVDVRALEESLWTHGGYRPASLDAPLTGETTESLGSHLGSGDDIAQEVAERVSLRVALRELCERDLRILKWRFERELTQSEIAERLGVSQMQVSRILRRILIALRAHLEPDETPARVLSYLRAVSPTAA